jgi:hypothetical protein
LNGVSLLRANFRWKQTLRAEQRPPRLRDALTTTSDVSSLRLIKKIEVQGGVLIRHGGKHD